MPPQPGRHGGLRPSHRAVSPGYNRRGVILTYVGPMYGGVLSHRLRLRLFNAVSLSLIGDPDPCAWETKTPYRRVLASECPGMENPKAM
jgi:hypothetical protein